MARDISELGADVFDDTVVVNKSKISPKKRNYIIGLSITGFLLAGAVVGTIIACNTVLLDYSNVTNVTYYFTPETALAEGEKSTAVLYKLRSDIKYPSTFRIPSQVKGYKVVGVAPEAFASHEEIKHVIFPNTIEFVGERAFINCTNLAKFTWSKNLTDVGVDAFENTKFYNDLLLNSDIISKLPSGLLIYVGKDYFPDDLALVSDAIPEADYSSIKSTYGAQTVKKFSDYDINNFASGAFRDNEKLVYVDFPSTVTAISNNAFESCLTIKGFDTTHSSITEIDEKAFKDCVSLSSITLREEIETIGDYAFNSTGITELPDLSNVSSLGKYIFADCDDLVSVSITLNKVPDYFLADCSNLESVEWGMDDININNVLSIGYGAFQATKLQEITIPKNITSIYDFMFSGCESLSKVLMYGNPNEYIVPGSESGTSTFINKTGEVTSGVLQGITSIQAQAFNGCKSLATIALYDDEYVEYDDTVVGEFHLPRSLVSTNYAQTAAGNDNKNFANSAVEKVVISPNMTSLGSYAFAGAKELKTVEFELPELSRLAQIKNNAFEGCTSLEEFIAPKSVTTIGVALFKGCTSITNIELDETIVESVPSSFVYGCSNLETIKLSNKVSSIKQDAFYHNYKLQYVILPNSINEIKSGAFKEMRENGTTMPVFYSWGANDTTRRSISSGWKDSTVQEYYFLAEGEEKVSGKRYWHYEGGVPTIIPEE